MGNSNSFIDYDTAMPHFLQVVFAGDCSQFLKKKRYVIKVYEKMFIKQNKVV